MKQCMEMNMISTEINGNTIHLIPAEKFKTTSIQLNIPLPLSRETATKAALLPYVLKRGCSPYPTERKINQRLEELYGAALHVDVLKKGEHQIMRFSLDIAGDRYIGGDSLLPESLQLLGSLLLQPITVQDAFKEEYLQIEKENAKKRIEAIIDDKIRYANMRLTQEMCKGEPYATLALGYKEDLGGISSSSLYQFYKEIVTLPKDWFVVGSFDQEEILTSFEQLLNDFPGMKKDAYPVPLDQRNILPKTVLEELNVHQGKLHMGFRTHTFLSDEDYVPLIVFNGIFGEFPHSKLFINVREKESLAYYAVSQIDPLKGILVVMSGIESGNFEKAKTIILDQLEEIRKGNISDQELNQTKAMLINQFREILDSSWGCIDFSFTSRIGNRFRSIEEIIMQIQKVTKEEIVHVSEKIELDTIYFLKAKEDLR